MYLKKNYKRKLITFILGLVYSKQYEYVNGMWWVEIHFNQYRLFSKKEVLKTSVYDML